MTAADILRERAHGAETLIDGHVVLTPAEVRAVADLMDAAEAVCRNAALVCDEATAAFLFGLANLWAVTAVIADGPGAVLALIPACFFFWAAWTYPPPGDKP